MCSAVSDWRMALSARALCAAVESAVPMPWKKLEPMGATTAVVTPPRYAYTHSVSRPANCSPSTARTTVSPRILGTAIV
ncbi:hypothetical protein FB451DRAFT_1289387, partial [Mycena latifolia]